MTTPDNPAVDRPPATSDLTVEPEAAALRPITRIGKFKIPTDLLRAYTMVFALIAIWIYFHFSTGHIFLEPRLQRECRRTHYSLTIGNGVSG